MPDGRATPKAAGKGLAAWQADLALRLLLDDPALPVPVSVLARSCGLSRSHFIRAFKVSMGLPPHHWLMRHRIDRARAMLARSTESIAAIAVGCGFADQSHLTRVFRALVGASPAAWRRQRRADIAGVRSRHAREDEAGDRAPPWADPPLPTRWSDRSGRA